MMLRYRTPKGSHHAAGAGAPAPALAAPRRPRSRKSAWRVPFGLVLVGFVPVAAGSVRLVQLSGGASASTTTADYLTSVTPLVLHIASSIGFVLLGASQFSPALRRGRHAWHRRAGRAVVPVGLIAALSALWLTWMSPTATSGAVLLYGLRMLFGSAMVASLVLGYVAIRDGEVQRHRVWMTRAYAIGLAAGTQAFTLGFGEAVFGKNPTSRALLSGAGWVINLAVAEWAISRYPQHALPRKRFRISRYRWPLSGAPLRDSGISHQ